MRLLTKVAALLFIAGCSSEGQKTPLLYKVEEQPFFIEVPAKGELFAAKSTVINAPVTRYGVQTLAWLAPEFSQVKEGEVIAKFDAENLTRQSESRTHELTLSSEDVREKQSELAIELSGLNKDIEIVGEEKIFANKYQINDETILSKLEILESMQDSEYLATKQDYLSWKEESFSESSAGEVDLLSMKVKQHENKLAMINDGLQKLEVKAPHDGLLVYSSNWRGEKTREGQSVWSGQKLAELPDSSEMKTKLFVKEKEAIGLAEGKQVRMRLNAAVDTEFVGTIESVANFPQTVKRGDPQKYFEVIVKLTSQNESLFVPGRKLTAQIDVETQQPQLIVPLQAIFSENNQYFVYLFEDDEFIRTPVELGQTSQSHAVIVNGLTTGQRISLTNQESS